MSRNKAHAPATIPTPEGVGTWPKWPVHKPTQTRGRNAQICSYQCTRQHPKLELGEVPAARHGVPSDGRRGARRTTCSDADDHIRPHTNTRFPPGTGQPRVASQAGQHAPSTPPEPSPETPRNLQPDPRKHGLPPSNSSDARRSTLPALGALSNRQRGTSSSGARRTKKMPNLDATSQSPPAGVAATPPQTGLLSPKSGCRARTARQHLREPDPGRRAAGPRARATTGRSPPAGVVAAPPQTGPLPPDRSLREDRALAPPRAGPRPPRIWPPSPETCRRAWEKRGEKRRERRRWDDSGWKALPPPRAGRRPPTAAAGRGMGGGGGGWGWRRGIAP